METGIAGTTARDTEQRLPRATKVKNKQPASKQVTAEQILREAKEIQLEDDFKAPKQIITDPDELAEYRLRKRKEYEDLVRRVGRFNSGIWVKYATWEEQQKDFRRARSVWERALDVDYRNVSVWLKYAEMEMRHRFVNHARNVWDRAVTLLPRIDQLWYKYVHMEEMLGNVAGAREVFERWMKFEPDHQGWMAYIKFELRYEQVERARSIYERYVDVLPSVKAWVRFAKFEMKHTQVANARRCYERAVEALGEDAQTEEFFLKFAEFEEKVKEVERARAIFKYALDHVPKNQTESLYQRFMQFEKQHGDREGIEEVLVSKRRFQYEEEVSRNPMDYDGWFDYIKLEESTGQEERVREVYERAVANVPPGLEKRLWQRYVFLWINYAVWEELEANEPGRAREVYRTALKLIPHQLFTFAKVWVLAAQLEVRQKNLAGARKILGMAIGMTPKEKLFKEYIRLEQLLGQMDRCRKLFEKYLEWNPANCTAWMEFAKMEKDLQEYSRARAVYELAVSQPMLDMPEALWKAYIDFEISLGEHKRTRALYERLLDMTKHVKVWLSYASFEANPPLVRPDDEDGESAPASTSEETSHEELLDNASRARAVYRRALRVLREDAPDAKEEAVMLLEAWQKFERDCAHRTEEEREEALLDLEQKMPRRVKKKRPLTTEDGMQVGMEEYYDYIFPGESSSAPSLKLLEAAMAWKKQKVS